MGSGIISKVLPFSAHPISSLEFTNALLRTCSKSIYRPVSGQGRHHGRIGLAISGGVDSMALAALCAKLQNQPEQRKSDFPNVQFQAFVVDHGVRYGSFAEALSVSEVLENRGIPTRVLRFDWGQIEDPGNKTNFESLARKHRFQALGKACKDEGIESLLLAHHEDDQAETVMMRMIYGHRILGLVGMKEISEIPECYGLYGICQSGGFDVLGQSPSGEIDSSASLESPTPEHKHSGPLLIESGGIKVYRPLLRFSKSRLVSTCHSEKMEWFDDHTNKDPSLTKRNAVRHMFKYATMPAALKPCTMIKLSEKCKTQDRLLNDAAQRLLQESFVSNFNTRTGTLTIRFAHINHISELNLSRLSANKGLIAALLLRRVIAFVTPDEHVHLSSLHGAVEKIFPEIFGISSSESALPTTFTVSGVRFQPLHPQTNEASPQYQKFQWQISRQPHSSVLSVRPSRTISPSKTGAWSEWELYDGRFWIRVRNCSSFSVVIRPFHKDDMQNFKQTLVGRDMLRSHAPELVRWTLPAIALKDLSGQERVVALPTLDIAAPGIEKRISWEVRYKNVDIDSLYNAGLCVIL